jgi:hypothetical protein
MVPDNETPILEMVFAAIHGAGWLGEIPVLAGDNLKDLGLSRLRLLATLIGARPVATICTSFVRAPSAVYSG